MYIFIIIFHIFTFFIFYIFYIFLSLRRKKKKKKNRVCCQRAECVPKKQSTGRERRNRNAVNFS